MELISRLSDRANLGCALLPWHQNIIIHIFPVHYILYGKHTFYTIYGTYRSKTVVENLLYATICHDLPPIRRNRSPAKAPAVANKKHFNHIKNPSCKGTICRVLPHFAQPVFRHILSKIIGRNGKSWQNEANRERQK